MKKVMLFTTFSFFTLTTSSFNFDDNKLTDEVSCFEAARSFVIAVYGEINLNNVQMVLDINEACEDGRLETR
ncbi:hypothetical protein [Flavobacteriaceae bacterium 14752]|uniref:hypothetical protein n=1 Tax=Mesohalobacter salilacus TaxID=2491711 RepID=UPI000F62DC34|nr:hypothetical protein EIG84_06850 [Flavobacteriaceae bacterium 14752]